MNYQAQIQKVHSNYNENDFNNTKLHYNGSANETIKKSINQFFCQQTRERFDENKTNYVLVLDGPNLYSSIMLSQYGLPNQQILVPNSNESDFNLAAKKLLTTKIPPCVLFPLTCYQLLQGSINKRKFSSIWLDFCSTFVGNSKFNPMSDIDLIFKNQLLTNKSNFGVTFYLKERMVSQERLKFTSLEIINFISTLASEYGYNLLVSKHEDYNFMMTVFFNVVKVKQNSNIEYKVESILSKQIIDNNIHYNVKWKNFDNKCNNLEPRQHLKNRSLLIQQFEYRKKRKRD